MYVRLTALAIALAASPAWANTSLPTDETFSSAYDLESGTVDPSYTPQLSAAYNTGDPVAISSSTHSVFAQTAQGSNRVYLQQTGALSSSVLAATSDSTWYDRATITGGIGVGTARFSIHINGTVDVGAFPGAAGYVLSVSSLHPFEGSSVAASWSLLASPYNDISYANGFSQTLTPGVGQAIDVTLSGTFDFTYGEVFYVLGSLHSIAADLSFLLSSCSPNCLPNSSLEGSGATTLDFSNSARLVSIVLPEGATASFASGATYNVTAVPEPAEWAMLLAGLGLISWRARCRSA